MSDQTGQPTGAFDLQKWIGETLGQIPQGVANSQGALSGLENYIKGSSQFNNPENRAQNQVNIPGLAFASGMMEPGHAGGFLGSVGNALGQYRGALSEQRSADLERASKIAELEMAKQKLTMSSIEPFLQYLPVGSIGGGGIPSISHLPSNVGAPNSNPSTSSTTTPNPSDVDAMGLPIDPTQRLAAFESNIYQLSRVPAYAKQAEIMKGIMENDPIVKQELARREGLGKVASGEVHINPSAGEVVQSGTSGVVHPHVVTTPKVVTPPAAGEGAGSPSKVDSTKLIPAAIPIPMSMTPGQRAQDVGTGTELAKLPATISSQADQAKDMNYLLDQLNRESQGWRMGKWADHQQNIQAWMDAAYDQFGIKHDPSSVPDFQAFNKGIGELVRQAARATSPRVGVQELQLVQTTMPSATMERGGWDQVRAQMQGANDFRLAKQTAMDLWLRKPGNENNMNGFDAWFNHNVNPATFMLNRMDPNYRKSVYEAMMKTPKGKATLAKLADQTEFSQSLGLIGNEQ